MPAGAVCLTALTQLSSLIDESQGIHQLSLVVRSCVKVRAMQFSWLSHSAVLRSQTVLSQCVVTLLSRSVLLLLSCDRLHCVHPDFAFFLSEPWMLYCSEF